MTGRAPVRALDGRRLATLGAALAVASALSGCFLRSDGAVVMPENRADIPWLAGAYSEGEPAGAEAGALDLLVTASVTRLDAGVYRFESRGREWPRLYRRVFRAFLGACPADIGVGLEPLIAELGEDSPTLEEAQAMIAAACAGDVATLCEEEAASVADATCPQIFAALRGEPVDPPLGRHAEEGIDAYRWVGENLPFGDDVVIATLPLDAHGAPGWALAEIKAIAGRGHYSGVQVFQPPSTTGDLILLRAAPEGRQGETPTTDEGAARRKAGKPSGAPPDVEAWSTAACIADESRVIARETAIRTLADCARRIAADPDAPEGGAPNNSHTFLRAAP